MSPTSRRSGIGITGRQHSGRCWSVCRRSRRARSTSLPWAGVRARHLQSMSPVGYRGLLRAPDRRYAARWRGVFLRFGCRFAQAMTSECFWNANWMPGCAPLLSSLMSIRWCLASLRSRPVIRLGLLNRTARDPCAATIASAAAVHERASQDRAAAEHPRAAKLKRLYPSTLP
jgi:hypothetical protein